MEHRDRNSAQLFVHTVPQIQRDVRLYRLPPARAGAVGTEHPLCDYIRIPV